MRFVAIVFFAVAALIEPAAAKKADPPGTVSLITDDRIRESSGLALSVDHEDLAYTINDRGTAPKIYAVKISTGEVVGTADISGLGVEDTESIAVDAKGILWLGDLGDNDQVRDNVAIYAFPEPGMGDTTITRAEKFPVKYPNGPVDVEGMLVHPTTGEIHLVSKNRDDNGTIYKVPDDLEPDVAVTVKDLNVKAPVAVTDAVYTHAGDRAVLRTNESLWVFDPGTWEPLVQQDTPDLKQGESVAVERGDRTVLIGSEGKNSPIVRFDIPQAVDQGAAAAATNQTKKVAPPHQGSAQSFLIVVGGGVLLLALVGLARRRAKPKDYYPAW